MKTKVKKTAGRRAASAKCLYCKKYHTGIFWNAGKGGWSTVTGPGRSRLVSKGWEGHDTALDLVNSGNPFPAPICEPEATASVSIPAGVDGEQLTVKQLCSAHLAYLAQEGKAADTVTNATALLDEFSEAMGDETVSSLRKGGVARIERWAKGHKTWGDATLEYFYKRIKRVFNWAVTKEEVIASSPIAKLNTGEERVTSSPRTATFSDKQIQTLLKVASRSTRCPEYVSALIVLLDTGCRPEELCGMTAADIREDDQDNKYVLVDHKNQKKRTWSGKRRPVRLITLESLAIVERLAKVNPTGPLFRNAWGKRWTKDSLLDMFRAVTRQAECVAVGLDNFEIVRGRREYQYVVYTCRHTFATRWVTGANKDENGQPIKLTFHDVADLMGNTHTEVQKTYAKVHVGMAALTTKLLNKPR